MKIRIAAAGLIGVVSGLILFSYNAGAQTDRQVRDDRSNTSLSQFTAQPLSIAPQNCPEAYIELAVDKSRVKVGEHFLLTAIYHSIGQPWVYSVGFNPEGSAVVDPPFDPPCKTCSVFQLRAVAVGRVEIGMCATGEIYCNGWMWAGACSKTPAIVEIDPASIYLPIVIH